MSKKFEEDYGLTAEQLDFKYNLMGGCGHPRHTREDWRWAVQEEETISGYWTWVVYMLEIDEDDSDD